MIKDAQAPLRKIQNTPRLLAYLSLGILLLPFVLTIFLIAFRMVQFRSENYALLVWGYRVGGMLNILLLPIIGIQVAGIVTGLVVVREHWACKVGAIGGGILLIVIVVFWVNIAEMMTDDLHPAVRKNLANIAAALEKQYARDARFPSTLDQLDADARSSLILLDPYDPNHAAFEYAILNQGCLLLSSGPDKSREISPKTLLASTSQEIEEKIVSHQYDPTNGVSSKGDIIFYSAKVR